MENKHTSGDLAQMQSLPLDTKLVMTKRRIKEWYEHWEGNVYVSFSGGKDSTVLKHIVDNMYDDVPSVFVNTGLEYPEIQKFVREMNDGKYSEYGFKSNIEVIRPKLRFDEIIQRYGYPFPNKEVAETVEGVRNKTPWALRIYEKVLNGTQLTKLPFKWLCLIDAPFTTTKKCCYYLKKQPVRLYETETGLKPFLGMLADESYLRRQTWIRYGCNSYDGHRPVSKPLSFWTEQDILAYIDKTRMPICPVYGEIKQSPEGRYYNTGLHQTGCMFCMFGITLEKTPNKFQRMKTEHPVQWDYCINKLNLKQVLDYVGVPYE